MPRLSLDLPSRTILETCLGSASSDMRSLFAWCVV